MTGASKITGKSSGEFDIEKVRSPALEYADGTKHWYINDKLHREDGPAIEELPNGTEWHIEGVEYTKSEFDKEIARRNTSCNNKVVEFEGKKYRLVEED